MVTRLSARHQRALDTPTGYRRTWSVVASRGGMSQSLEPVSGSVTQDARRGGRWDGRLSFIGDDLLPRRPSDLLAPFGTVITITAGLELLDGTTSVVPLGVMEITSARARIEAGVRMVDIGIADLSERIDRYRFEEPLVFAAGADLADVINAVVTSRIGVSPGVTATGSTLGVQRVFGLSPETGPWAELLDVLRGFSLTAWYDRSGQIVVGSTTVDPTNAYALGALTSVTGDFDSRPPNVIVVRGEAQDGTPPVTATALDDDPGSPTYAGASPGSSPYGRVTLFFASPLIETEPQAQAAAATILARHLGQGATHTLARAFDPTIDAGDVVAVDAATYAVDAITVDMTGQTTAQARAL